MSASFLEGVEDMEAPSGSEIRRAANPTRSKAPESQRPNENDAVVGGKPNIRMMIRVKQLVKRNAR